MTTPMPWSMKKRRPMLAPGWISMPVTKRLKWEMRRGSSGHAAAVQRMGDAVQPDGVEARDRPAGLRRVLTAAGSRSKMPRMSSRIRSKVRMVSTLQ